MHISFRRTGRGRFLDHLNEETIWIAQDDRASLAFRGGDLDRRAASGDDGRIRLLRIGHHSVEVADVKHDTARARICVCGSCGLAFQTLEMGELE